jgi:hypothetical protein
MIDRKKVVERHYPRMNRIDPLSPLSVGNGSFAFTADVTGLQTFPGSYNVPLGTQSHWGWHYTGKAGLYTSEDIKYEALHTNGREVGYPLYPEGHEEAYHWLRQNPHRLQLGQISFRLLKENGEQAEADDLEQIDQVMDLWDGALYSDFYIDEELVSVITVCHAEADEIGVFVTSSLIASGRLQVQLHFPSPDMASNVWEESTDLNWKHNDRHQTVLTSSSEDSALITRIIDEDSYVAAWNWNQGKLENIGNHAFMLIPDDNQLTLTFSIAFSEKSSGKGHNFDEIFSSSYHHWQQFWNNGAVMDFSMCTDPRAFELERRVVLSQFLLAVHSAGPLPPQETGLMYNSWYGKFHLEMHWWHGAHFPLWSRAELLEKSMDWYTSILPLAQELAKSQGYEGARWPKQVGIDGKASPSPISPVLIWQQPHPMALAELCYRANPSVKQLERWKEVVRQSADFMASFAVWDEKQSRFVLGPPLIPAQENHKPQDSCNPPYELEYWKYGLEIAIKWAERLNESINPKWLEIIENMSIPPHDGEVYLAHENCPDTFKTYNHDHPSMVGALGLLPGSLIEPEIMRQTLKRVESEWQWDTAWGWDFPMCAMTAARLGEGSMAVDFLLMDAAKNIYLANGHNYQREGLSCYLPGNGGLLTAVAMMASGWQGGPDNQLPGFPQDGSWNVKWEGLLPIL